MGVSVWQTYTERGRQTYKARDRGKYTYRKRKRQTNIKRKERAADKHSMHIHTKGEAGRRTKR